MTNHENLVPFQKGYDERRQNGRKRGSKNVSTIVKEILETDFEEIKSESLKNLIQKQNCRTAKEAIISAITQRALDGDLKSTEWIFKYIERDETKNKSFFEGPLQITIIDPKNKTEKNLL